MGSNMSVIRYLTEVWTAFDFITEVESQIPYVSIPSGHSNNRSFHLNINGSIGKGLPVNATDDFDTLSKYVINSFLAVFCLGGLVGNGMVIWLLGFRMKRNPFTTYILNLSVADFGVLLSLLCTAALAMRITHYRTRDIFSLLFLISFELFFFTYSASQFLLTAISIDRCVAVLFPLWHRCHRPTHQSAVISALIWVLSFLLSAIHFILLETQQSGRHPLIFQLIVNVFLCTPLMVVSTFTLCTHFCRKTQQRRQEKLITVIFLALFVFLILSLPLNVTYLVHSHIAPQPKPLVVGLMCSSLNSSVNPLIYFLIGGRHKKVQLRACLKFALQTVFKDEEDSLGKKTTTSESIL
ncbi:hypothetical protein JRQ81_010818 [Phrynocephalus forsythii]|uniref:G-protein coupled receptors family 1 profile domain-containing protein n=1 Tax=Phrynocephalus forsythii TaxID=171643 RepID=A0A9Q0Y146_9SAUR|nr:hypothetical protein JRQ81_010818 [Phrynocephalus forsythii]